MPHKDPEKRRQYGRERMRKWRAANPERALENGRKSEKNRKKDPIKKRAYNQAYYSKNKEALLAANKIWDQNNREYINAYKREQYKKTRKPYERQKAWADKNRSKVQASVRKWNKAHPEVLVELASRRRARQRDATVVPIRRAFWAEAKAAWNGCCAYCGEPCPKPEWDHFMPLARQGAHSEYNLVPACQPCNGSKGSKDPFIWLHDRNRKP